MPRVVLSVTHVKCQERGLHAVTDRSYVSRQSHESRRRGELTMSPIRRGAASANYIFDNFVLIADRNVNTGENQRLTDI